MKKIISIVLALTMMFGLMAVASFAVSAEVNLRGDVNGDGAVDSDDAIYLLNYAMADEETRDEDYPLTHGGDVNGDGAIDSDDAIYLLNYAMADEETRDEDYPLAPEAGGLDNGEQGNVGGLEGGDESEFMAIVD